MSAGRFGRRKALRIVLGVLAAILLALGGIYLDAWFRAGRIIEKDRHHVADKTAKLRNTRVMRPVYFGPGEEGNSWEPLMQGLEYFKGLSDAELEVFPSFQEVEFQLAKIDAAGAESLLARAAPAFENLRVALRRAWTEPSLAYEEHVNLKFPHVSGAIRACRILENVAAFRHDNGRASEAVECLVLMWGVADRTTVKGPLVTQLVSLICRGMFLNCLKEVLSNHALQGMHLARLQELIGEKNADSASDILLSHTVDDITCRFAAHNCIDQFLKVQMSLDGSFEEVRPGWREGWSRRIMVARFLGEQEMAMVEVTRLGAQSPKVRQAGLEKLANETFGPGSRLYRTLFPHYGRAWINQDEDGIRRSVAIVALAVARFQEDHGRFPGTLTELAPTYLKAVPRDEINEAQLNYYVRDGVAHVYALGADGDDDGGRPWNPEDPTDNWEMDDGDLVWTVKRRGTESK